VCVASLNGDLDVGGLAVGGLAGAAAAAPARAAAHTHTPGAPCALYALCPRKPCRGAHGRPTHCSAHSARRRLTTGLHALATGGAALPLAAHRALGRQPAGGAASDLVCGGSPSPKSAAACGVRGGTGPHALLVNPSPLCATPLLPTPGPPPSSPPPSCICTTSSRAGSARTLVPLERWRARARLVYMHTPSPNAAKCCSGGQVPPALAPSPPHPPTHPAPPLPPPRPSTPPRLCPQGACRALRAQPAHWGRGQVA
jgi:hypothetical protein